MIRVMDLFSGIGGFSLGLKKAGGFTTVCYCEIDQACQQVLYGLMLDGALDTAPICTDVKRLDGAPWAGRVELICGGFPCQDISAAGLRAGIDGERSGLWREIARLVRQVRPRYVLVENVAALLGRGLERVLGDLAACGYDSEWDCLPASAFGAPHQRDRVFVVSHARSGWGPDNGLRPGGAVLGGRGSAAAPNSERWGLQGGVFGRRNAIPIEPPTYRRTSLGTLVGEAWQAEPGEGWLDDGLPPALAEALSRCLGNSVVPQVVEWIGRRIVEVHES